MKVIKRDGRTIEFDREKIVIAIEKANREVKGKEKATKEEIEEIIQFIEDIDKKRILVEDIQDIIEQKLMEIDKYELAKKYIVYRYTRALVRKSNTTDESILGLIRNQNKQMTEGNKVSISAAIQRDYIAGEVSRDLTKRILLPEKISKAQEEEILYFHDADYFIQPMINNSFINIEDMLENGFEVNEKKIKTPETFRMACIIITQIMEMIASNQYGRQTLDLTCLGKYLIKSREKYEKELIKKYDKKLVDEVVEDRLKEELDEGIQIIESQINTLKSIKGKESIVLLYLKENEENLNIIKKISKDLLSENDKKKKFDQGEVTINLLQIGKIVKNNEEKFFDLLDERLELCYEALMCRHYALLGTPSDISPIHWQSGGIARLNKGEKIDKYLKSEYSSITLGYFGINEAALLVSDIDFSGKIMKYLKERVAKWKKENNIEFILCEQLKQLW